MMDEKFSEIFEERYNDSKNPQDGTYLHPLEYSIMYANGEYKKRLTEEGEMLIKFFKYHIFKENPWK